MSQSTRSVTLCSLRGTLYDRNGQALTNRLVSYGQSDLLASFPIYTRYTGLAPHLIGYPTSALSRGYTGLEGGFASVLQQYSGVLKVSYPTDAEGNRLSGIPVTVEDTLSQAAGGVVLTLDARLQQFAGEQLGDLRGGIVVMQKDGEVLALCSSPAFDPDNIQAALQSTASPLLDRTLSAYDVGSVFKTAVAAAALEAGVSPERRYNCVGQIDVNGVVIRCHRHSGHGEQTLKEAFGNSCNPYFIDLALELGKTDLLAMAQSMGFGQAVTLAPGIRSKAGNLPSSLDLSVPAALANFAIGQGTLLATPLQVAAAVNCVATAGMYVPPQLVLREVDEFGHTVQEEERPPGHRVFSKETGWQLLSLMRGVFENILPEYDPPGGSAGKTSTAQTGMVAEDGHKVCQTWLAGVWPAEDPQYTVVVFVEDGESGSVSCGPLFQAVCRYLSQLNRM